MPHGVRLASLPEREPYEIGLRLGRPVVRLLDQEARLHEVKRLEFVRRLLLRHVGIQPIERWGGSGHRPPPRRRCAADDDLGIHAITVEVGDPLRFQRGLIRLSRLGIQAVLDHLDMYDHDEPPFEEDTVECRRSYWLRTDAGGALHVLPDVADFVRRGDRIAVLRNVFGDIVKEYSDFYGALSRRSDHYLDEFRPVFEYVQKISS